MKNNYNQIMNFNDKVYSVVIKIAPGSVMTYKEVAEKIDHPKAWRAVGRALNQNINPDIPCHRVIKSNGLIGGYRLGSDKKKSILRKEGFIFLDKK